MHRYSFTLTLILILLFGSCRTNTQPAIDLTLQKQLQELTLQEMFINTEYYDSTRRFVIVDSVNGYARMPYEPAKYIADSTEITSLLKQDKKAINLKIDYEFANILNYKFISKEETNEIYDPSGRSIFWEDFYSKYPNSVGFIEFSAFRISNTGKYAIGEYLHMCGGLCGSVVELIYELVDGNWKLIHHAEIIEF